MRFMVMVKATGDSEAGVMPSEQMMAEMGRFNEELVQAVAIPTSRSGRSSRPKTSARP